MDLHGFPDNHDAKTISSINNTVLPIITINRVNIPTIVYQLIHAATPHHEKGGNFSEADCMGRGDWFLSVVIREQQS